MAEGNRLINTLNFDIGVAAFALLLGFIILSNSDTAAIHSNEFGDSNTKTIQNDNNKNSEVQLKVQHGGGNPSESLGGQLQGAATIEQAKNTDEKRLQNPTDENVVQPNKSSNAQQTGEL